jgi:hypothetical protein
MNSKFWINSYMKYWFFVDNQTEFWYDYLPKHLTRIHQFKLCTRTLLIHNSIIFIVCKHESDYYA